MPESTLADFTARFLADSRLGGEPTEGRIVLSGKRLVLASNDGRTTVPLHQVFDVVVGHVPDELSAFFDDAVAIAYSTGGERVTALVEADGSTIVRFRTVLFGALLQGCSVLLRHPAMVGGRRTGVDATTGELGLEEEAVTVDGPNAHVRIELSGVTHVQRTTRRIDDGTRPALVVQSTDGGRAVTAEIVMDAPRPMNLLRRYLRIEYADVAAGVRGLDLSGPEISLLTAVYSGAGADALPRILDVEPSSVSSLLGSLEGEGLLSTTPEGPAITSRGRIAVTERLSEIEA